MRCVVVMVLPARHAWSEGVGRERAVAASALRKCVSFLASTQDPQEGFSSLH